MTNETISPIYTVAWREKNVMMRLLKRRLKKRDLTVWLIPGKRQHAWVLKWIKCARRNLIFIPFEIPYIPLFGRNR